ncbi:hypothetical protein GYMLUDRAFT_967985 [Collybiopsis luxurians FD-317 M1]|uniref:Uncharacterized protein n=1 Tax=Collybiopsis luxurians FD-317 M1 TaxID=944289 RepID=A0A0D0CC08_9AGAR|nr:hypothetical protein GYMLUDRAFT_967985 [Collybiopsis luxurians FD-317 M1]
MPRRGSLIIAKTSMGSGERGGRAPRGGGGEGGRGGQSGRGGPDGGGGGGGRCDNTEKSTIGTTNGSTTNGADCML